MPRQRTNQLSVNRLEDRSTPSVSAMMTNGTLFVTGSPSTPLSEVRLEGSGDVIRVLDGQQRLGLFRMVHDINVRLDQGANVAVTPGTNESIGDLNIWLGKGDNSVFVGAGSVKNVSIFANYVGKNRITVSGLNAQNVSANLGAGKDEVNVVKSAINSLNVHSAEQVNLDQGMIGTVQLENRMNEMSTMTLAEIKGDLSVVQRGGTLTVDGSVGGSLAYNNVRAVTPSSLVIHGAIRGSLSMIGTQFGDYASFNAGAAVEGNLALHLGAGNDRANIEGSVGTPKVLTTLIVDAGLGDDVVSLTDTATIWAPKAAISLGQGDDQCFIAKSAYYEWLELDGGDGKDSLVNLGTFDRLAVTGFESTSSALI